MKPRFSVVIATRDRVVWLEEALETVFSQTCAPTQILVANDGSTDGTETLLARFADRVIALNLPQSRGQAMARNHAVAKARGDWLVFLDDDDRWFPWTLASLATAIARTNPNVVIGRSERFREAPQAVETPVHASVWPDLLAAWRHVRMPLGTPVAAMRRDVFQHVGGFADVRCNGEDIDLLLRLGTQPRCAVIHAPATVGWRVHATNHSADPLATVAGARWLRRREAEGAYPGGKLRNRERRLMLRHSRFVLTRELARAGHPRAALAAAFAGWPVPGL